MSVVQCKMLPFILSVTIYLTRAGVSQTASNSADTNQIASHFTLNFTNEISRLHSIRSTNIVPSYAILEFIAFKPGNLNAKNSFNFQCKNDHRLRKQDELCKHHESCYQWALVSRKLFEHHVEEIKSHLNSWCHRVWYGCPIGYHQCNTTQRCISPEWICDGINDCQEGTDEINCHLRDHCPRNYDRHGPHCIFNNDTCPSQELCNLMKQCANCSNSTKKAESEKYPTAQENYHYCDSQLCLPLHKVCNGIPDCADKSDEGPSCKLWKCPPGYTQTCNKGKDVWRCIPLEWLCDGYRDCEMGNDEAWCKNRTCPDGMVKCKGSSGQCIPRNEWCDNVLSCRDGSDELSCNLTKLVNQKPTEAIPKTATRKHLVNMVNNLNYYLNDMDTNMDQSDNIPHAQTVQILTTKISKIMETSDKSNENLEVLHMSRFISESTVSAFSPEKARGVNEVKEDSISPTKKPILYKHWSYIQTNLDYIADRIVLDAQTESNKNNNGVIIGASVSAVGLVTICIIAGIVLYSKKKKQSTVDEHANQKSHMHDNSKESKANSSEEGVLADRNRPGDVDDSQKETIISSNTHDMESTQKPGSSQQQKLTIADGTNHELGHILSCSSKQKDAKCVGSKEDMSGSKNIQEEQTGRISVNSEAHGHDATVEASLTSLIKDEIVKQTMMPLHEAVTVSDIKSPLQSSKTIVLSDIQQSNDNQLFEQENTNTDLKHPVSANKREDVQNLTSQDTDTDARSVGGSTAGPQIGGHRTMKPMLSEENSRPSFKLLVETDESSIPIHSGSETSLTNVMDNNNLPTTHDNNSPTKKRRFTIHIGAGIKNENIVGIAKTSVAPPQISVVESDKSEPCNINIHSVQEEVSLNIENEPDLTTLSPHNLNIRRHTYPDSDEKLIILDSQDGNRAESGVTSVSSVNSSELVGLTKSNASYMLSDTPISNVILHQGQPKQHMAKSDSLCFNEEEQTENSLQRKCSENIESSSKLAHGSRSNVLPSDIISQESCHVNKNSEEHLTNTCYDQRSGDHINSNSKNDLQLLAPVGSKQSMGQMKEKSNSANTFLNIDEDIANAYSMTFESDDISSIDNSRNVNLQRSDLASCSVSLTNNEHSMLYTRSNVSDLMNEQDVSGTNINPASGIKSTPLTDIQVQSCLSMQQDPVENAEFSPAVDTNAYTVAGDQLDSNIHDQDVQHSHEPNVGNYTQQEQIPIDEINANNQNVQQYSEISTSDIVAVHSMALSPNQMPVGLATSSKNSNQHSNAPQQKMEIRANSSIGLHGVPAKSHIDTYKLDTSSTLIPVSTDHRRASVAVMSQNETPQLDIIHLDSHSPKIPKSAYELEKALLSSTDDGGCGNFATTKHDNPLSVVEKNQSNDVEQKDFCQNRLDSADPGNINAQVSTCKSTYKECIDDSGATGDIAHITKRDNGNCQNVQLRNGNMLEAENPQVISSEESKNPLNLLSDPPKTSDALLDEFVEGETKSNIQIASETSVAKQFTDSMMNPYKSSTSTIKQDIHSSKSEVILSEGQAAKYRNSISEIVSVHQSLITTPAALPPDLPVINSRTEIEHGPHEVNDRNTKICGSNNNEYKVADNMCNTSNVEKVRHLGGLCKADKMHIMTATTQIDVNNVGNSTCLQDSDIEANGVDIIYECNQTQTKEQLQAHDLPRYQPQDVIDASPETPVVKTSKLYSATQCVSELQDDAVLQAPNKNSISNNHLKTRDKESIIHVGDIHTDTQMHAKATTNIETCKKQDDNVRDEQMNGQYSDVTKCINKEEKNRTQSQSDKPQEILPALGESTAIAADELNSEKPTKGISADMLEKFDKLQYERRHSLTKHKHHNTKGSTTRCVRCMQGKDCHHIAVSRRNSLQQNTMPQDIKQRRQSNFNA